VEEMSVTIRCSLIDERKMQAMTGQIRRERINN
jgi:hypothetical protein